jgi:hypothetical protein
MRRTGVMPELFVNMNPAPQPTNPGRLTGLAYAAAVLGAFLIVAALVWAMRHYTQAPDLNANRAAERAAALKELRAAEANNLHTAGWIDQGKGVVRLPIDVAMQIALREWENNPSSARSNLISRVEKATAVPPPKPAAPNPFE